MRVISGRLKGRQLVAFDAGHIRPTTDRVKETLFNILMGQVEGSRVLDLFSGTGNLAIECISRGAAWVDLVEIHKRSLNIIRQNIDLLGISEGFKIFPMDTFKYLKTYTGDSYDIILADPPFTQQLAHELIPAIAASRVTGPNTTVVIEASAKERLDDNYPGLKRLDQRKFGDKHLNLFGFGLGDADDKGNLSR